MARRKLPAPPLTQPISSAEAIGNLREIVRMQDAELIELTDEVERLREIIQMLIGSDT